MKVVDKIKGLSKSQKIMVTAVAVLAVGGIGGTVYANEVSKRKLAETQKLVSKTTNELESLDKEVNELFDSKDNHFLIKDVTEEQVGNLRKKVDDALLVVAKEDKKVDLSTYNEEKNKVQESIEKLETTLKTQSAVNNLYKKEKDILALNGTEVKKDLAIVDDLKKETVESTKKEFYKKDSTISYDKVINELIVGAENQLKQIDVARQAVVKVFKDKVISTDQKLYDSAKTETDKIKNEKAKKELADQLVKVKADIDKKVAEEKKKTEEARKQDQSSAKEQGNVATNQNLAGNTNQEQANNDGYTGTNANQAWDNTAGGGTNQNWQDTTGGNTNTDQQPSGGGTTNSPNNNNGGGNSGGNTNPVVPSEPTIVSGYIGNSGMIFNSAGEANSYGNSVLDTDFSKNGYKLISIYYSDGSVKFSIDFY